MRLDETRFQASGGAGLPPFPVATVGSVPPESDASDDVYLFTCIDCGHRWTNPHAPVTRCGCGGDVACHTFHYAEYNRIRHFGDPREGVGYDDPREANVEDDDPEVMTDGGSSGAPMWARFTRESQQEALDLFEAALEAKPDRVVGVGVSTYGHVHVHASCRSEAFNIAVDNTPSGDIQHISGHEAKEIDTVDQERYVESYYDEEYQAWEVGVSGWSRFYCIAGDSAEVSHTVQWCVDTGMLHPAVQATDWLADFEDVNAREIIYSEEDLREIIEDYGGDLP